MKKQFLALLLTFTLFAGSFNILPAIATNSVVTGCTATPRYSSIRLNWNTVTDATSYKIERSDNQAGPFKEIITYSPITSTEFIDGNLEASHQYYYRVKANNQTEYSAVFTNATETGFAALQSTASIYLPLTGDDRTFDGTKFLDVTTKAGVDMSTLASTGTMIVRFKRSTLSTESMPLVVAGTGVTIGSYGGLFLSNSKFGGVLDRLYGFNTNAARFDTVGQRVTLPYLPSLQNEWQTMIYSGDTARKDEEIIVALNGSSHYLKLNNKPQPLTGLDFSNASKFLHIGGTNKALAGTANTAKFTGEIDYVMFTPEKLSRYESEKLSALNGTNKNDIFSMFNAGDNKTWVFTGANEVVPSYASTKNARNFVGDLEDIIRFKDARLNASNDMNMNPAYFPTGMGPDINGRTGRPDTEVRQCYFINSARNNYTVAMINENFTQMVSDYKSKAVVLTVGKADYSKGAGSIEAFKTSLRTFLDKAYANQIIPLVITPPPSLATDSANIELYITAINAVKAESGYGNHVIDIYNPFKARIGNANLQNTDGTLNAQGNLDIAEEILKYLKQETGQYTVLRTPNDIKYCEPKQLRRSINVAPTIVPAATSIAVTIPSNADTDGTTKWEYNLSFADTVINAKDITTKTFTIADLPSNINFTLSIKSQESSTDLVNLLSVRSSTTVGSNVENIPHKNENDQTDTLKAERDKIKQVLAKPDGALWMFFGDSITQANHNTSGFDSTYELLKKFLLEKGRDKDVVLNTAIAGGSSITHLYNEYQRSTKYTPDVVIMKFGMNDGADDNPWETSSGKGRMPVADYKENLRIIVNHARAIGAVPIIRSTTPSMYGITGDRIHLPEYVIAAQEVAQEMNVIFVNNYADWRNLDDKFMINNGGNPYLIGDAGLHPNAQGHLLMFKSLLKAMGQYSEDSFMSKVDYTTKSALPAPTSSTIQPTITPTAQGFILNPSALQKQYRAANTKRSLAEVTMKVTTGGRTYSATTKDMSSNALALTGLTLGQSYTVAISAKHESDEQYRINDGGYTVNFTGGNYTTAVNTQNDIILSSSNIISTEINTVIGDLTLLEGGVPINTAFTLVAGVNDNAYFSINGNRLAVKQTLSTNTRYTVKVSASGKEQSFSLSSPSTVLDKSLVAHFDMDNIAGGKTYDNSPSNIEMNVVGSLNNTGKINKAIALNGTTDYMESNAMTGLRLGTSNMSACVWINPSELTSAGNYIFWYGDTTTEWSMRINANGSIFCALNSAVSPATVANIPAGTIAINQWTHLAFIRDGMHLLIYKNGTLLTDVTGTVLHNLTAANNSLRIGRSQNPVAALNRLFKGSIDEFRVYNTALTAAEVGQLATSTTGIFPSTAIAIDDVTIDINGQKTISPTFTPTIASNRQVSYVSSDPTVATITNGGELLGIKQGTTTITATAGALTDTCVVTVTANTAPAVPATGIGFTEYIYTMNKGDTLKLNPTITPNNALNKKVNYLSYNVGTAIIDENGVANGLYAGTAVVKATLASDTTKTALIKLIVLETVQQPIPDPPTVITIPNVTAVTITAPVKDILPTNATVTSDTYSVTSTIWKNGTTVHTVAFAPATAYNVEIILTAKNGYKFTDGTLIPDGYNKTLGANGETLTLTNTFTKTKFIAMDMNGDNKVDLDDALLALKYQTGTIMRDPSADNTEASVILDQIIKKV